MTFREGSGVAYLDETAQMLSANCVPAKGWSSGLKIELKIPWKSQSKDSGFHIFDHLWPINFQLSDSFLKQTSKRQQVIDVTIRPWDSDPASQMPGKWQTDVFISFESHGLISKHTETIQPFRISRQRSPQSEVLHWLFRLLPVVCPSLAMHLNSVYTIDSYTCICIFMNWVYRIMLPFSNVVGRKLHSWIFTPGLLSSSVSWELPAHHHTLQAPQAFCVMEELWIKFNSAMTLEDVHCFIVWEWTTFLHFYITISWKIIQTSKDVLSMRYKLPNLKPVFQSNSKNLTSTKASPNFLPSGASHLGFLFLPSNDFSSLMINSSRHFQALHCCNFSGTKDFTSGTLCSKFKPINLSGKIKKTSPPTALQKGHRDIIQLDFQAQLSGKDGDLQVQPTAIHQWNNQQQSQQQQRKKCGAFLCTSVPPKSSRGSGLDLFDKKSYIKIGFRSVSWPWSLFLLPFFESPTLWILFPWLLWQPLRISHQALVSVKSMQYLLLSLFKSLWKKMKFQSTSNISKHLLSQSLYSKKLSQRTKKNAGFWEQSTSRCWR